MTEPKLEYALTDFERTTAEYFAGGKELSKKHVQLATKKCKQWNDERVKLGLKPFK